MTAKTIAPKDSDGSIPRWFKVEQQHGIPTTTQGSGSEIWVPGPQLAYPGEISHLQLGYQVEVSQEEASRCCYSSRPTFQECIQTNPDIDPLACDPGEECEGGGSTVDLDYGWTPTPLEWAVDYDLQTMIRNGQGPANFDPMPFPCDKS